MIQAASHCEPDRPAAGPGGLARWRRAIVQGNDSFEAGDAPAALAAYRQALDLARGLPPGTEDAVAALVVSHHNLARLHEAAGRADEAAGHVCEAHETLCARAADAAAGHGAREAAWRHSRVTHAELLRFLQRHPGHDRASRAARLWPGDGPAQTLPH